MLVPWLIAIAAPPAPPALTVADFWPMTPGLTRTYKTLEGKRSAELVETVGKPTRIGGKDVVPIITTVGGFDQSHVYYAVENETVMQMAVGDKELLKTPLPIMKVGPTTVKWTYTQLSPVSPKPEPLTVTAESTRKGAKKILGVSREILEIKFEAQSAPGMVPTFKWQETAVYAAGIGQIELDAERTVGTNKATYKSELTAFSLPGASK